MTASMTDVNLKVTDEKCPAEKDTPNTVYGMQEHVWLEWKRKRRRTFIGVVIIGLVLGMDCSIIFSTLYLYFKDLLHTKRPEVWYGVTIAAFYTTSSICGVFSGNWLDRSRNVRKYVTIALSLEAIGFLFYSMSFHPTFVLIGRIICGIGDPFNSVIAGEIFRIYDKKESTRAILITTSVYSFGFLLGPCLNPLFSGIDFHIGKLIVKQYNFIGIFMGSVSVIVIGVANKLIYNCSEEFDLKAYLQMRHDKKKDLKETYKQMEWISNDSHDDNVIVNHNAEISEKHANNSDLNCISPLSNEPDIENKRYGFVLNENESIPSDLQSDLNNVNVYEKNADSFTEIQEPQPNEVNETTDSIIPVKHIFKTFFVKPNLFIIFSATAISTYGIFAGFAILPMVLNEILRWQNQALDFIYIALAICDVTGLFIMTKFVNSSRRIYFTLIVSLAAHMTLFIILMCFVLLSRHNARDLFLVVVMVPALTLSFNFDNVCLRIVFGNMIPSSIQSFSETTRSALNKMTRIAGSFSVIIILPWLQWWSLLILLVICLLMLGFVLRWRYFIDPKEEVFEIIKK